MVETVFSGLESSRRVTTCAIYLRDQEGNGFDLFGSIGDATGADGSPLLARIPRRLESLAIRPLLDRLQKQLSVSLEELARDRARGGRARHHRGGASRAAQVVGRARPPRRRRREQGAADTLVGFICLADSRVRDAFTPEEIALLETVAAQVGVAIANSRIYTRMKERDRLAALGAMAAGLAHEVKNPLGAIKGAAQLLEEDGEGGARPAAREWVGIILEEVEPPRSRRRELPRRTRARTRATPSRST